MGIAEFIQSNIFLPRLKQKCCLVIYDPDLRYRDICLDLASATVTIIDATENGLESRIDALRELRLFGIPNTTKEGVLVYVPVRAPVTDEEKSVIRLPFIPLAGACFRMAPATRMNRSVCGQNRTMLPGFARFLQKTRHHRLQ